MRTTTLILAIGALSWARTAAAAPTLRVQAEQQGDVVLIGQTLAQDCRGGVPSPLVGSVGSCGSDVADGSVDVFWRADSPMAGAATADVSVSAAQARSSAVLALPPGAVVTHARVYWAAKTDQGAADTSVLVEREGAFSQAVIADDQWLLSTGNGDFYQATADITALVALNGAGAYRIGDVEAVDLANADDQVVFAGWSLVVFYTAPGAQTRSLALFDGFERVDGSNPESFGLSGFLVPPVFDATLGVVAFEGDAGVGGDDLRVGIAPLSNADRVFDASNPNNNFFNATRTTLGAPFHLAGDLPELTGEPDSMGGVDIDVVDISGALSPGQTVVDVAATSSGDVFFLGPLVTSIRTVAPNLTTSTKTAVDVNGPPLLVGDELEYTIVVENQGNDPAIDVVVNDPLPPGTTYVPTSLTVEGSPVTDTTDGDVGEVVAGQLTARVGAGADGTTGGQLAPAGTATVVFRVLVDQAGAIDNQATVSGAGLSGSAPFTVSTDGDPNAAGVQPTSVFADGCATDADCAAPTPACDTAAVPSACVECLGDTDCPDTAPICDVPNRTCGPCGDDSQCGAVDSGRVCDGGGCIDGCRGEGGNGCPDPLVCDSVDGTVGMCGPAMGTGGEGGMGGAGGRGGAGGQGDAGAPSTGGFGGMGGEAPPPIAVTERYEGGGCRCGVVGDGGAPSGGASWWWALGLLALRRRERAS